MTTHVAVQWRYEEINSAVHGWLVKLGFRKRGKKNKNVRYSHTTYNGFNICVPNDPARLSQFYLAIAQDLYPHMYEGRRSLLPRLDCLNQLAGVVFRVFFEFDPPDGWVWTRDEIRQIVACAQKTLVMFGFVRKLHRCTIDSCEGGAQCDPACFSPDRTIPQSQAYISTKAGGATGVHLVFPEIRVNVERISRMRPTLLFLLYAEGPKPPANIVANWHRIVDEKVSNKKYNVHMRMNFAAKVSDCECKANKVPVDECPRIDDLARPCRKGYIFEPSFYHVTDVLGENGIPDELDLALCTKETGVVYQLQRTSICPLREEMDKEFYIPPEAPAIAPATEMTEEEVAAGGAPKRNSEEAGIVTQVRRDAAHKSKVWRARKEADPMELAKTDPIWLTLQAVIRRSHYNWRQLNVTRVHYIIPSPGSPPTFWVRVEGLGQHTCLNRLPDEHGNCCHDKAKIWFEVSYRGTTQRCSGGTERQRYTATDQPCSRFRSNPAKIPIDMVDSLFPSRPMERMTNGSGGIGTTDQPALMRLKPQQIPLVQPAMQNLEPTEVEAMEAAITLARAVDIIPAPQRATFGATRAELQAVQKRLLDSWQHAMMHPEADGTDNNPDAVPPLLVATSNTPLPMKSKSRKKKKPAIKVPQFMLDRAACQLVPLPRWKASPSVHTS